jgi:hypothetical protein
VMIQQYLSMPEQLVNVLFHFEEVQLILANMIVIDRMIEDHLK